jgi:uncharacterized protein YebE (UPF0316 family)
MELIMASPWLLTGVIFLARILDVSLGTLRTLLVIRSYRFYAALLGFLETVVWVLAAAQVLRNLNAWYLVVAYAAGFAAGNVVGIWLESKLAVGMELVRAISENREIHLAERLRAARYGVIELAGTDGLRPVEVLLITERRRKVPGLLSLIKTLDPTAVCTISDAKRYTGEPESPWPGWTRFVRRSIRK